ELIPASHLKQSYYRADTMKILGLAADKKEAFDLCHKMIRDCYVGNGVIDREGLWDSGGTENGTCDGPSGGECL
ncbi:MAG: hypothetical protein J6I64_01155, partial [Lachnospiraceae bacterium]|nr:hypothetical protein [Lachnospiraceae bacterium]